MKRKDRLNDDLREIRIFPDFIGKVPGSVLIEQGQTKVICTATYERKTQLFLKDSGKGWIQAEYSMLPGSTGIHRHKRERSMVNNRNIEIQRFIGRALRNTLCLQELKDLTIFIDADVVQADGSTRCTALNGSMIALVKLLRYFVFEHMIADLPEIEFVAAVSVGVSKTSEILIDLDYQEDAIMAADINVVSSEKGNIIEVLGFAEEHPISFADFNKAVALGVQKNHEIISVLKKYAGEKN
jgi:ribonuclease PH